MSKNKNFSSMIHIPKLILEDAATKPHGLKFLIEHEIERVRREFHALCANRGWQVSDQPVSRHCLTIKGKFKRAYATREEAEADIQRVGSPNEVVAYECPDHGWHLGGQLSRKMRAAVRYGGNYIA